MSLSGTQFISNSARFSAGGVYANAGALAVLNGGLFQGNLCTQTGCRGFVPSRRKFSATVETHSRAARFASDWAA